MMACPEKRNGRNEKEKINNVVPGKSFSREEVTAKRKGKFRSEAPNKSQLDHFGR